MLYLIIILIKIRVFGANVKYAYKEKRIVDYSRKYIKNLLKLFKNTKIYYIVFVAVHTRHEKSGNS